MVFGPVDHTPGKKMVYYPRPMRRGQAESRGAKNVGIQIMPEGGKKVHVDHKAVVTVEGLDPRDQQIADLQAAVNMLLAEKANKKKPGRPKKDKPQADAEA